MTKYHKVFLIIICSLMILSLFCRINTQTILFAQEKRDKLEELRNRLKKLRVPKKEEEVEPEELPPFPPLEQEPFSEKKEEIKHYPGMVYIPEGEFIMGTNEGFVHESPKHIVYLEGFHIDKYEVTNFQYKRFINATEYNPPKYWKNNEFPKGKDYHPVVGVSYHDAEAYAKWAGKRLPSEQEWEKAARYTDGRNFPWGDYWKTGCANVGPLLAWFGKTKPIGSYPEGANPYGLYDLSGNATEWTSSFFKPYAGNIEPNKNYGESHKAIRGGSCRKSKEMAHSFRRGFLSPSAKKKDAGFRCAK